MEDALRQLRQDPVLARAIDAVGPLAPLPPVRRRLERAVRIIVGQQLSVGAARTIWQRLRDACGGVVTAERLLALDAAELRGCGLSGAKVRSIQRLAAGVRERRIDLAAIARMDAAAARAALLALPGFGPWSADMYQLSVLGHADVFAPADAGLRRALCRLYQLDPAAWPERALAISEAWRPHRSLACRYLWRWLDAEPG